MIDCLVVGGGPAGLMAAETVARAGHFVHLIDQMPSLGRKFLMAGKSGLNLTKDEPLEDFLKHYPSAAPQLIDAVKRFGPEKVKEFATGLDQDLFTGSTKRVFPKVMKASPMLRTWLHRLESLGVTFRTRTSWETSNETLHQLSTGSVRARTIVFAMGGGSWARLGSDGVWASRFDALSIPRTAFEPSNVGLRFNWSSYMEPYFGAPLKDIAFFVGNTRLEGEAVITSSGLEGAAIYNATPYTRRGASIHIDLRPDISENGLKVRLQSAPAKTSQSNLMRKALGLSPAKQALLNEWYRPLPKGYELVSLIKSMIVPKATLGPIDAAISTAGGVDMKALDSALMIRARPGWFVAGEMLDWNAPTGGYLLTACFATGKRAGEGVVNHLS